jgi:hypothetical protein
MCHRWIVFYRCLVPSLLIFLYTAQAMALPEDTWVIAIGNNRGDASDVQLLYAERDATEMATVLRSQGPVAADRVQLLIGADADTVRRTIAHSNSSVRARMETGSQASALVVFYSGHADNEALHLRGTRLPFEEIRELVKGSPATIRLFIVDACRSGTVTRVKGIRQIPEFQIQLDKEIGVEGMAILSSSTADEFSQESDRLRASFFSHHLVNALRGAGDRNGDGHVTLSEAYDYTYTQTLRSSGQTLALQHPTYAYDVKGSGDLVLTFLADAQQDSARLRLSAAATYLVTDEKESGPVVAEFTVARDRAVIALPHGRYFVQRRGSFEYREYQVTLRAGEEVDLENQPHRALRYDQLVRKRGGVRRSVHGIMVLAGARGEVLAGEGVTPQVVLGYSADLPWLTVSTRLRTDYAAWNSDDGGLLTRRYELGLSLLLERYIDLPWLSLAFGVSGEGLFEAQRYDSGPRQTPERNTLGFSFGALVVAERRLYNGLSLRIEGGPLAILDRRAIVTYGQEVADTLTSTLTWWTVGGIIWRR